MTYEETNNDNNYFCSVSKFPNGLMFIVQRITSNVNITSQSGNIYYANLDLTDYTYPTPFVATPRVFHSTVPGSANGINGWIWGNNGNPSTNNPGGVSVGRGSSASGNVQINILSVGRWR